MYTFFFSIANPTTYTRTILYHRLVTLSVSARSCLVVYIFCTVNVLGSASDQSVVPYVHKPVGVRVGIDWKSVYKHREESHLR